MWIRSQNRRILSDVNEVLMCNMDENKCIISGFWDKGSDTLGIYSSEEKAFAVLDEIQKRIEYPGSTLVSPTALKNYYRLIPACQFYQMPQDDEVEVWN